ncbi:lytic murein transglycosylase [Halopseudomonas maritima]|uniref:lytic murein transglycosylase n=1 Tax=Halopseudomonas maritima TaxID=2918528 RepID=UPI001EEBF33E|nr:lytic murein transglycosylase [Halopseudomonas maritima]UJJ30905.1 lytic murein transglycosylase [Halopseudomonas maritima]
MPARRTRLQLLTSLSLLCLGACAETPSVAQNLTPAVVAPTAPATASVETPQQPQTFSAWQADFRREALSKGIDADLFDRAFSGVTPDPDVIRADRSQPEFSRPVWAYLDGALSNLRVAGGKRRLRDEATTFDAIEQRYGVDRHILTAIWGLESNFGQNMGSREVIRSLATLAHEGRRPAFAHDQLLAALDILQHRDIEPRAMLGSWAGAMGQTQFIPTTYNQYAVDFDGNGRRDIWNSSADALASAAHYLKASGWQSGQRWGQEVRLGASFDYALADPSVKKSVSEWQALGVRPAVADSFAAELTDKQASILLPAGYRGPAFLLLHNFSTIMRYNNSTSYALAIGLLSDRFQGNGQIQGQWPTEDRPLSRSERLELQRLLTQRGLEPGGIDGIIGANTRNAIRRFQQQRGVPADGYASAALLEQLRAR